MSNRDELLDAQFLVFSSHKTATQTVQHSLHLHGLRCGHCHTLFNLGLEEGVFQDFLAEYKARNGRPLALISAFREPMERMVSSFFQSLSVDATAWTNPDESERWSDPRTALLARTPEELRALFEAYCVEHDGFGESLAIVLEETGRQIANMAPPDDLHLSTTDFGDFVLHAVRFDHLVASLPAILFRITGQHVSPSVANESGQKYYVDIYREFRRTFRLPRRVIEGIYEPRRALVDFFYPGQYEALLAQRIRSHAADA